jgi:hypothetical protein
VSPLPLDIDELKLRITAVIETIDSNMLERVCTHWTFVGAGMELTISIFRACRTSGVCHPNGTAVMLSFV